MRYFQIILLIAILSNVTYGQDNRFSYHFELGTLLSVGPSTFRTDSVRINNVTEISYPQNLRFEHPSARLRMSMLYEFAHNTKIGIESGISLRFGESYYNNTILYSFPIQGKVVYYPIELKNNILIGIDGTAGYHFQNLYRYRVSSKGGYIYSIGIVFTQNNEMPINWFVKFGFEKQNENTTLEILAREPGQKVEYYKYKIYRNQALISVGINLR